MEKEIRELLELVGVPSMEHKTTIEGLKWLIATHNQNNKLLKSYASNAELLEYLYEETGICVVKTKSGHKILIIENEENMVEALSQYLDKQLLLVDK